MFRAGGEMEIGKGTLFQEEISVPSNCAKKASLKQATVCVFYPWIRGKLAWDW